MTIATRTNHIDDAMIDRGIAVFTTPLANADGSEPTSVVQDLEAYLSQERGPGGRTPDPTSIKYSVLSILMAFYLCMRTNREVSLASGWTALVHEATPEQRTRMGMTGDLTGTRYDVIAAGLARGATVAQRKAAEAATQKEYARAAKVFSAMADTIDHSPFPRDRRLTAAQRKAIAENPDHRDRRIPRDLEIRNRERFDAITNKIVVAEAMNAPEDGFLGDTATDEVIVISNLARKGQGTGPGKWHSTDPDTKWWTGKHKSDPEYGFGYGITYVVRMARPYGKPALNIPIGIYIGEPTGGRVEAYASAQKYAALHRLTIPLRDRGEDPQSDRINPDRYTIADQGFSAKDGWVPTAIDLGYKVNAEYPDTWLVEREIPDVNAAGKPAPGPRIAYGRILCPGAAGLHATQRISKPGPAPEHAKVIVKRQRTIDFLESLVMPIRNGLKRVKTTTIGGGRPRAGQEPLDLWSITVQCPAGLGLVNCANAPLADGSVTPGLPDVPNPPFPGKPHLWPKACLQESVTYRLDIKQIKHLQAEMLGTYYQKDMFETMRSANERFHSQLKHPKSGGIANRNWTEINGIAKRGLLFAIATTVTIGHMIDGFDPASEPVSERETERRRRSKILSRLRRSPEVSSGRKKKIA